MITLFCFFSLPNFLLFFVTVRLSCSMKIGETFGKINKQKSFLSRSNCWVLISKSSSVYRDTKWGIKNTNSADLVEITIWWWNFELKVRRDLPIAQQSTWWTLAGAQQSMNSPDSVSRTGVSCTSWSTSWPKVIKINEVSFETSVSLL